MEASWNVKNAGGLLRASFPEELRQHLEFQCAAASSWHWGNPVAKHRKRYLQKHAKAAINQTDHLSSRWKILFDASPTVSNILDGFEAIVPGIIWVRSGDEDYNTLAEDEEACASDVEREMISSRLYQAHHKETSDVYKKISNLSYIGRENQKSHWKLAEVLSNLNHVRSPFHYLSSSVL